MGCKIDISGLKVGGDAEILDRVEIGEVDNIDINVKNLNVDGKMTLLNDLQINTLIAELREKSLSMDKNSKEYVGIQEILRKKKWNKADFIKQIGRHMASFSEGVLASIVAGFLIKQ